MAYEVVKEVAKPVLHHCDLPGPYTKLGLGTIIRCTECGQHRMAVQGHRGRTGWTRVALDEKGIWEEQR